MQPQETLGNARNVDVTLLDRRNHHLFQPLLYQVATAGLSPADIAAPIRSILSEFRNIEVLEGEVTHVDLDKRMVVADFASFDYDYLILACGSLHSYFGHDEWEEYAPGLKTIEGATEIRRRILSSFISANFTHKNRRMSRQKCPSVIPLNRPRPCGGARCPSRGL